MGELAKKITKVTDYIREVYFSHTGIFTATDDEIIKWWNAKVIMASNGPE